MRQKSILAALLLMVAGLQTAWAQKVTLRFTDKSVLEYNISSLDCIEFSEGNVGEHEYVDLGLPSGTLWATCNVGANSPEEYGDYFAWGETKPKDYYDWTTYKYSKGDWYQLTKYSTDSKYGYNGFTDGLMELLPEDDAATANWGSDWQTPSPVQWIELICRLYTTIELVEREENDEVICSFKITSKQNGNSIIIPCPGQYMYDYIDGLNYRGHYWSRSLIEPDDPDRARSVYIKPGEIEYRYNDWRLFGLCVRPVRVQEKKKHEYVDLGLPSGTLWATCNVGASSPEEYGEYFAWGETSPRDEYNWANYMYCKGSETTMTKYCTQSEYGYNGFTDNLPELESSDDAATAYWGNRWQMPSIEQCEELINSDLTTTQWTAQNGTNGYKITSKSNGNSIFLPAAGCILDTSDYGPGSFGYYRTRSLSTSKSSNACCLNFLINNIRMLDMNRYYGQSVRPVRIQDASIVGTWEYKSEDFGAIRLTFSADGKFLILDPDSALWYTSGNYSYSEGNLIFDYFDQAIGTKEIKVVSLTSEILVLENFYGEGNSTWYRK